MIVKNHNTTVLSVKSQAYGRICKKPQGSEKLLRFNSNGEAYVHLHNCISNYWTQFLVLMVEAVFSSTNNYNNIRVTFPLDPCDVSKIQMPDFYSPIQRISETKCLEYTWRLRYEQGKIINGIKCLEQQGYTFVLGGSQAEDGQYPHMAALGWKAKVGTWIFKCGSSLISERYALTAAHCSKVKKNDQSVAFYEPKIVRLGGKSIADYDGRLPAYDVEIRSIIVHHRYSPPKQYYDIALIQLAHEVSFTWLVHPACLWTSFDNPDSGILTGWGVVDTSTLRFSTTLQHAEIKIIDSDECNNTLKFKRNRNWWGIMRHQLCAGEKTGQIDTCQGDSGGPLQSPIALNHSIPYFRWSLHKVIGVTSFGFGCAKASTPGIYTRVTSFLGWIESIVWPQNIYFTDL